ncbi:MAG: NUDIX hydrolase [Saprospiraceae bacterium]|nr:NUDIX hydrolase [Saprospiraceae bacterium]
MSYTYEYPRPSLTVDCVIFGLDDSHELRVLLIERAHDPYADCWALPGGFVDMHEDLYSAAARELEEETGIRNVFIEQLYTFGAPKRDPRGRVVSVAYYALVNLKDHPVTAASDAKRAEWFKTKELPKLAFDHQLIMDTAIERLTTKIRYQPIGFELLPEKFTLSQLRELYETILGKALNKRNFRSKIMSMDILEQVEQQKDVPHRPAYLYRFNKKKYAQLTKEGFVFEI